MRFFITGGAGFIGSNFARRCLELGHQVSIFDNLSVGRMKNLDILSPHKYEFFHGDLLNLDQTQSHLRGHDIVAHFAANADVQHGLEHIGKDLKQNVIATHNLLEAMTNVDVKQMLFASTAVVVGEPEIFPTPENLPMPIQTSFYGASKISAEGFISSFANAFDIRCEIFRFVSVVGPNYSHGHVYDFVKKLKKNPDLIEVLGDGNQEKSVIHVDDLVDAIFIAITSEKQANCSNTAIYNLGSDDFFKVRDSARWVANQLNLKPKFDFTGGERGWVGDQPKVHLDTTKIKSLGWRPKYDNKKAIETTTRWLIENDWVFDK